MNDVVFFKNSNEFRKWLKKNYNKLSEQWVGFYKKDSGRESIDWPQSVDQALCFGWIDGLRKGIDEISYKIRFTPRKPGSNWSAINIKKVKELTDAGLMLPAGLDAYSKRVDKKSEIYSYEDGKKVLEDKYVKLIKKNKKAWEFFNSQAPWYRKTAEHWIQSAVKEETRLKRLNTLIEDSASGKIIGPLKRPGKNNSI